MIHFVLGSIKKIGRLGGKSIQYFKVITALALILGMVIANIVQPGAGINAAPESRERGAVAPIAEKGQPQTTVPFIAAISPLLGG